MKSKTKNQSKLSWVQVQAEYKQKEFDEKAKELVWQLTDGGGFRNAHVFDTIRSLEWAYLALAAYRMAACDENYGRM